jgi:hypothetical protein
MRFKKYSTNRPKRRFVWRPVFESLYDAGRYEDQIQPTLRSVKRLIDFNAFRLDALSD